MLVPINEERTKINGIKKKIVKFLITETLS